MDELDALRDMIRKELNELADITATGGCASWENYQRLVGRVEGLASAERFILDLKQRAEED
ncbi:MAG: hypothetical protein JW384_04286 [Nitrosomonadaceae bacterium]|nr:hypothetical protein [Nitrosomonadaceae bacterium]